MMNKEKWKVKSYVSFIVKALVLLLITFQLNLLMAFTRVFFVYWLLIRMEKLIFSFYLSGIQLLHTILGGAPISICHFFSASICLSICYAPCLKNRTWRYHNFWYTWVKWYFHALFPFFKKTLIFWVVFEVKGQKIAQNEK